VDESPPIRSAETRDSEKKELVRKKKRLLGNRDSFELLGTSWRLVRARGISIADVFLLGNKLHPEMRVLIVLATEELPRVHSNFGKPP
jgi:hypothetical protein